MTKHDHRDENEEFEEELFEHLLFIFLVVLPIIVIYSLCVYCYRQKRLSLEKRIATSSKIHEIFF